MHRVINYWQGRLWRPGMVLFHVGFILASSLDRGGSWGILRGSWEVVGWASVRKTDFEVDLGRFR